MRTVDAVPRVRGTNNLSKTDTNETLRIRFPVKAWLDAYPDCVITVIHRRSHDPDGLPAAICETDGVYAYWLITDSDTAYAGDGEAELRMKSGTAVSKSETYNTHVDESVGSSEGPAPEPVERVAEQIADDAAEAVTAANRAESAAERAESASVHGPTIGETGTWLVWDAETEQYADTGVVAEGQDGQPGPAGPAGADAPQIDDTQASAEHPWSGHKVNAELSLINQAILNLDELKATKAELALANARLRENERRTHLLEEAAINKLYTDETVTETSYQQTVPSGSLSNAVLGMWGGKSVVWNQHLNGINSTNWGATSSAYVTTSYSDGIATVESSLQWQGLINLPVNRPSLPNGHKVLWMVDVKTSSPTTGIRAYANEQSGAGFYKDCVESTNWQTIKNIITWDGATEGRFRIIDKRSEGFESFQVTKPYFVDLNQMGYGDITSVDDPRIRAIESYALAHPAYNAGEIVSAEVNAVQTADTDETVKQTYTIPSSILQQYPLRSAGSVYDTITYEPQTVDGVTVPKWKHTQNIKGQDIGDLDYTYQLSSGLSFFRHTFSDIKEPLSNNVPANAISAIYTSVPVNNTLVNFDVATYSNSNGVTIFVNNDYTDVESFKSAMSGVMFYYELDEPIVTDITELMQNWNGILEVEEGGTVTFKQVGDTIFAIPNTVNYLVKTTTGGA